MKLNNGDRSIVSSMRHPNISWSTSRETPGIELPHMSEWEKSQSNRRTKHDIWASSSIRNSTINRTSNMSPKRALNLLSQSLELQKALGEPTTDMYANYLPLLLHPEWIMWRRSGIGLQSTGENTHRRSSVN